ncbi:hypothetical protein ACJX0J_012920, partial [Zea mays]
MACFSMTRKTGKILINDSRVLKKEESWAMNTHMVHLHGMAGMNKEMEFEIKRRDNPPIHYCFSFL